MKDGGLLVSVAGGGGNLADSACGIERKYGVCWDAGKKTDRRETAVINREKKIKSLLKEEYILTFS